MTSFEKLGKMAGDEMDIRLAPLTNIIEVTIRGMKAEVTIGVERETAQDLLDGKLFVGGLVLADKTQFDAIEASPQLELNQKQIGWIVAQIRMEKENLYVGDDIENALYDWNLDNFPDMSEEEMQFLRGLVKTLRPTMETLFGIQGQDDETIKK